jgi:integrase
MATQTTNRKGARKRGNGEGSVYQRKDGTWAAAVMVGRKANGTPDRRTVYGKTRAEAVRKLDELRQRAAGGLITEPNRLTVEAFLTQWLRDCVALNSRPSTLTTYTVLARKHVMPCIGAVKLSALRPAHIQSVYAAMLAKGRASATVRTVHALLHRAFKQAVGWGYLPRNPTDEAAPPALRRREMQTLSVTEANRLVAMAYADEDRYAPLWRLLVDTGARIGEALALTWTDLNVDKATLTIQRTLRGCNRDGSPRFGPPKTERSRRTVTLTPETVKALRTHRAHQNEEKLAYGPDYADHGLIFARCIGIATPHRTAFDAFRRALRRAGLSEAVRLHDLRHTSATLMLESGLNPRVVADRLGHSGVGITLSVYAHVTPSMEAEAAARLARVLDGM